MGSIQFIKASLSPFSSSSWFKELNSNGYKKGVQCFSRDKRRNAVGKMRWVCCKLHDSTDSQSNGGDEPPESLFMKELRKRGISSSSLLEESSRSTIDEEKEEGGDRSFSKRNAVATGSDKSLTNQREQSMALNSEGIEGLIPRAKALLTLGGTSFLAFWPLILATVAFFAALYLYFGPTFVHDGSKTPNAPPQYVDPYTLLQDERIGQ